MREAPKPPAEPPPPKTMLGSDPSIRHDGQHEAPASERSKWLAVVKRLLSKEP